MRQAYASTTTLFWCNNPPGVRASAFRAYLPSQQLIVHASYDRIFQTPSIENLLLTGSPAIDSAATGTLRLPVTSSHANFYELGITKGFTGKLRVSANWFRREFHDFADDDLLLNTGIAFPIAFAQAQIQGTEVRVEVSQWGRFSGYASYTNQTGIAQGPITGGLFLGQDGTAALSDTSRFAITQDQRNTLRTRLRFQAVSRVWLALSSRYGSGLPVEFDNESVDTAFLLSQYGDAVLNRVNLDRGRVRPSFSLDAAVGVEIYRKELKSLSLMIQTANLTNRVNVINFASLFSGTAIGPPRSISARIRATF